MRLDRLMWFLRFVRSRSRATALVREGRLRLNGNRVLQPNRIVRPGDVLTIPLGRTVRLVRILAIPTRRGPASQAVSHYVNLDPSLESEIPTEAVSSAYEKADLT
jgi:ribosome-associated heat shock protein Hsp15